MTDLLSTDCETRARARAWISKFNEADGRYLSQKKRELATAVTASPIGNISAVNDFWREISRRMEMRIPEFAGVIGRWGSHFIRANFSQCEIGDAIPFADDHPDGVEILWIYIHPPGDYDSPEKRRFQKVCCETVGFFGASRTSNSFWERTE